MAVYIYIYICLSFSDIVEGKSTQLSLKVAAGKYIDTVKDNRH